MPRDHAYALLDPLDPNGYHGFDLSNLRAPITYFGHHQEHNKEATDQASEALREFLKSMFQGSR